MVARSALVQDTTHEGSRALRPGAAAQPGGPLVRAVRALSAAAGNRATVRMLTRQRVLARTPGGEYAGKTIAELKALAKTDPDAVWELRGRYQNMTTEELRVAARRDALARQVAAQRRALALTAVRGDPRWPGHQLPHEATAVSRNAQGDIVWRGAAASGSMTPAERAMPFPQGMNASHTEVRLTLAGELPRGGTFRITGQYDPCPACQNAMRAAADRTGCTIEYWWQGAPNGQPFVARPQATLPPGTPPPAVPPPVKARPVPVEQTPRPTVAPKAPRIGAGVRITIGIGLNVALFALFFWLGKKKAEQMERDIKRLNKTSIEPAVDSALVAQVAEGDRVNAKDVKQPMYANVTVDWRMEWEESGIGGTRTGERITDARFVSLSFSHDPIQTKKNIDDDCSGWGQVESCYSVTRVTYPVLVYHPDHESYKKEQLSGWDEFVEKNPWARMKPITGEAAKNVAALRWRHGRVAVADWIVSEELKRVRSELGLDREPEPRVQVIAPR